MKVRFALRDVDHAHTRERIRAYFAKKEPRIERLLSKYPPDLRRLQVTVRRSRKSTQRWEVRFVLQLPTGTLATEEVRPHFEEAMDVAVDELLHKLRHHQDVIRKSKKNRRWRERVRFDTVQPMIRRAAQEKRPDEFFELLKPCMAALRDHARRELEVLEIEQSVRPGEFSIDDIVDDVVMLAWQRFADRPSQAPLELWLLELLHERFDQIKADTQRTKTGSEMPVPQTPDDSLIDEEDPSERDFWLEQLYEVHDPPPYEELIPDPDLRDALEKLDEREREREIQKALVALPPRQRRTLELHALRGFAEEEIASVQDRGAHEVREDLQRAREALGHHLRMRQLPPSM